MTTLAIFPGKDWRGWHNNGASWQPPDGRCYSTTLLSWHREDIAPQLRTNTTRRSRDSSHSSPIPRSLHFIHLHYKLVYYFALLARAARKKSWHNETSPRGCFEAQQRLKWIWWFGLQKEVTSWNKDFLHFRQPAAAFLRLYLYLHDTSQSIITVLIRYGVSSWCFIFPHNTRVKCNIFYRQRRLYASERLSRIWPEVDKSSRRLVDFARENQLLQTSLNLQIK